MKTSVIGAGNVGATAANVIALKKFTDELVLLDIKEGFAEGKIMDMMQTAHMLNINTKMVGTTGDYAKTAHSNIIIITSGLARKPGMTREELIGTNAKIVKGVMDKCLEYSSDAIFIIVSNPADTLTYLALKDSKLPHNRVIGMSGVLDSNRFIYFLSQKIGCPPTDVDGMVIGVHGDLMLPLTRLASYKGIPVTELLDNATLEKIIHETKVGGGTLTKLLGTSAWYAPGAAVAIMAEAIALNTRKLLPCIAYLDGEYGEKDVCAGVAVILGASGAEKIVTLSLTLEEREMFAKSVAAVRETNAKLSNSL